MVFLGYFNTLYCHKAAADAKEKSEIVCRESRIVCRESRIYHVSQHTAEAIDRIVPSAMDNCSAAWTTSFDGLYDDACNSDDAKMVQLIERMVKMLVDAGLAEIQYLQNSKVGVHPSNRGHKLLAAADVHSKGAAIVQAGFAYTLCGPERAIAFEVHPTSRHIQEWTCRLSSCTGMFPWIVEVNLKVGSVGCSHLAQFLNCVDAGCSTKESTLCRPGTSTMSKTMLVEQDAVLGVALQQGLKWTVIKWQVEEKYPQLPGLIANAMNVEHHISQGETWSEQLSSIGNRASQQLASGQKVDWKKIAKDQAKTQPPCVGDILAHVKLCQIYGGGKKMLFVRELTEFLRLTMRRNRVVSGDFISKLASMGQAPDSLTPRVIMACIKTNATCDEVKGFMGSLISTADVAALKKKGREMQQAESTIARTRALMDDHKIADIDKIGRFEMALLKCILEKQKHWTEGQTLESLTEEFAREILPAAPAAAPAPSSTSCITGDVLQYDELTGQAVSAGKTSMIASGFEVGKNVELNAAAKGDKKNSTDGDEQFRIAYINDDGSIGLNKINFDGLPMPDVVVVSFADAQAKYKPSRVPIEMMANYPGNVAHESDAWTEFLHQTIASTAMHTMLHEFGPPPIFMIQSKPVMRVRAINAFSKGALVVVPVCSRFTAPRGSGFEVVMSLNVPDNPRVALAPLQSESNVSPLFCMRKTTDTNHANMQLSDTKVTVVANFLPQVEVEVVIPVAVNIVAIKPGDELVLQVAVAPKKVGARECGSVLVASKRLKA